MAAMYTNRHVDNMSHHETAVQLTGIKKPDPKAGLTTSLGVRARGDHRYNNNPLRRLGATGAHESPIDSVVELFAPDLTIGKRFDPRTLLCGDRTLASEPLIDEPLRDAELPGELCLADLVLGEVVGEVHGGILAPLFCMSRAPLVVDPNSIATLSSMEKATHQADNRQAIEAERLAKLFAERNAEGLSQEEFGARYNIGTQGMMWQLLNGRRPLNMKSAVGFAKGLKVPLEQISESIALEVREAATTLLDVNLSGSDDSPEPPDYVDGALRAITAAYANGVPREVFDAIKILVNQLLNVPKSGNMAAQEDETVKPPAPKKADFSAESNRALRDTESRLAARDEAERGARRTGESRSEGARHRRVSRTPTTKPRS